MGRWGIPGVRGKWDAAAFAEQTPDFVKGVANGLVTWGYVGQRTDDAAAGITLDDVRWLLRTVGRIADAQIDDALRASGADEDERRIFGASLRKRIERLREICEEANSQG
jgi:hypothetical protein